MGTMGKCKWCKADLPSSRKICDACKIKLREVRAKVLAATSHDTPCLDRSCGRCWRCTPRPRFAQGDGKTCEDCGKVGCVCEAPTRMPAPKRMR